MERAVFRGVYDDIFALFQAFYCVGNFHTIRPSKVVGTYYLDSSYVTFKHFAFLSVWDKFELLVACENIRFSSLFVDGDVSRGTSPAAKSEEKRMFSQAKLLGNVQAAMMIWVLFSPSSWIHLSWGIQLFIWQCDDNNDEDDDDDDDDDDDHDD